jgi:penicillin-binding protein 2
LQLAVATSVLASRGERRIPRLLKSIDGEPVEAPAMEPIMASAANWDSVYDGMREVVHGKRGTAKKLSKGIQYEMGGKTGTAQQYEMGGKTGTAQVIGIAQENGGGSSAASPIARKVIDTWLLGEAG